MYVAAHAKQGVVGVPRHSLLCRDCGEEFVWYPGKPGYRNQCEPCAVQAAVDPDLLMASEVQPAREDELDASNFQIVPKSKLSKYHGVAPTKLPVDN